MSTSDSLVTSEISLADRAVWVVKEPVSDQFYFFEQDEFEAVRKDLPRHVPTPPPGFIKRRPPWWSNPLAIRVPGIDPAGLLDRCLVWINSVGQQRLKWLSVAGVVFALVIVLMNLGRFVDDVSQATSSMLAFVTPSWFAFMIAIAVVKVCHELAHGIACHLGGGKCREMGVLFLLGVPCLYCDVSDTWLMPKRKQRVLVSAAGMIGELLLASVAVFVWAFTRDGSLHDVAAMIVVVASVSTLAFNANPLMRYDGYFMLSDWVGIPNLAQESTVALREWIGHRVAGDGSREASGDVSQDVATGNGRFLVCYAIASGLYRLFVWSAIVWLICGFTSQAIGWGAAIPVGGLLGWLLLRRWFAMGDVSADQPEGPNQSGYGATWIGLAAVACVFVLVIPMPQSFRCMALVRPASERMVYARATGTVQQDGDELHVRDWRLELRELAAQGQVDETRAALKASEIARLSDPEVVSSVAVWRQRLLVSTKQLQAAARRVAGLSFRLGENETLFDPPPVVASREELRTGRFGRTGSPLEPSNANAVIPVGTLIGSVGDVRERTVSAFVPGHWIESVAVGQRIVLAYPGLPTGSIHGRVQSISDDPVDALPLEVAASGWVRWDPASGQQRSPLEPHFEVTMEIDSPIVLPARLVSPVRIHVDRGTLGGRLRDAIQSTFVF
ncbi:HlyD family efflux transporter periplasmic adaptor subunit [Neorhodopirellula lusitana]|uniref:HlyD family efflux transporter periplasmic adaptor subunit n=1 Tax=Neorhodopirellula lusitana TaxID=445327 RepID=UPI00384DA5DA